MFLNSIEKETFLNEERTKHSALLTFQDLSCVTGERAKQLSLGAKPMVKNVDNLGPKEIARLELEQKVLPLIIIRTLPNGLKEKWRVNELVIVN